MRDAAGTTHAKQARMAVEAVQGLPRRMGSILRGMFARDGVERHENKVNVIDKVWSDTDLVPLDAPASALHQAADACARECFRICETVKTIDAILLAVGVICRRQQIPLPQGRTAGEITRRALDRGWWLRSIRKAHARRFEHVAIQLGFVSYKTGVYVSDETVQRQRRRNKENAKLLASIEVENELGQTYSLEKLAALGTSNPAIRRGELMNRIRGFEEIATDLRHVGVFSTITAPSKYHAVLSKSGEENPRYIAFGSPTPRDAQAYLCEVLARFRSSLHRKGIRPYGFRIAEPHHDGCPHWHMLVFLPANQVEAYQAELRAYALAVDGEEPGAQENRVKLVNIEAGKGTAAGYIAKYVAKNIDGEGVGQHKTAEGWDVTTDLLGNEEITPSQRVVYWAQVWGIRQFQQIGGAPIGVWRELRRIKEETVRHAPEAIKEAWKAVQKTEGSRTSFASYLRQQGGPAVGRAGLIQLAKRTITVEGKYATYQDEKPCGVYHAWNIGAVYESVRHVWKRLEKTEAVAVAVPWTRVNNCTRQWQAELKKRTEKGMESLKGHSIATENLIQKWQNRHNEEFSYGH